MTKNDLIARFSMPHLNGTPAGRYYVEFERRGKTVRYCFSESWKYDEIKEAIYDFQNGDKVTADAYFTLKNIFKYA